MGPTFSGGVVVIEYIERTSMHLKSKIFSDSSVDREKSENYSDIYFMAFALKETVLKIAKEKSN